jgi:hypothetical protein
MLLLSDVGLTIAGASVFPDHRDPLQFWYLPTNVHLAERDGLPVFTLFKYRNRAGDNSAARGGGFLTFEVNLRLTKDEEGEILKQLRAMLKSRHIEGEPRLAAVTFETGSVKCVALDLGVEQIMGATSPSLYGTNTAMFSLTLNERQVTLFDAAFKDQSGGVISPIGVVFDLSFQALRPRLQFKATADISRVYQEFKVGVEGAIPLEGLMLKGNIKAGLQKLIDDGAISVESTVFTADEAGEKLKQQALDYFTDTMITEFFTPVLTLPKDAGVPIDTSLVDEKKIRDAGTPKDSASEGTTSSGNTTGDSGAEDEATNSASEAASAGASVVEDLLPRVTFALSFVRQDERRTRTYLYNDSKVNTQRYFPQGFFTLLVKDLSRNLAIHEVDLDDDFFKQMTIIVEPTDFDFASYNLQSAQFELEYDGRQPDGQGDGIFRPGKSDGQRFTFYLNKDLQTAYRYNVEYNFRNTAPNGELARYKTTWEQTQDRTQTINPDQHLGFMNFNVELDGDFQWIGLRRATVHIDYQGPSWKAKTGSGGTWKTSKEFLFRPNEPATQTWQLRLSDPEARQYSYYIEYVQQDGATTRSETLTSETAAIIVPDLTRGRREMTFLPQLNYDESVEIEVVYSDAAHNYNWSKRVAGRDGQKLPVSIPLLDPSKTAFSYTVYIINDYSGEVDTTSIPAGEQSAFIPVRTHSSGKMRVTISAADMDWSTVKRVDLQLRYAPKPGELSEEHVKFEQADAPTYDWSVPLPAGSKEVRYEWAATFYTSGGSVRYPSTLGSYEASTLNMLALRGYAPRSERLSVDFDAEDVDWEQVDSITLEVIDGTYETGPSRGTRQSEKLSASMTLYSWEPQTTQQTYAWKVRFKFTKPINGSRIAQTDWKIERFDANSYISILDVFNGLVGTAENSPSSSWNWTPPQ